MLDCVVPTLNSSATLEQTLLSLHMQREIDVRITIIDSGSTDGTQAIGERWGVPVLYAEPGNMYRAINRGLRQCQGPWLTYLNADDWIYPDSLSRLIRHGENVNASIVYGNGDYADSAGRFLYSLRSAPPGKLSSLFDVGVMAFPQPATIFRREVYECLNGFDERYRWTADADFYLRAVRRGIRFGFLDGLTVACFRIHEHQQSRIYGDAVLLEKQAIYGRPDRVRSLVGQVSLGTWRLKNTPHYLIRILRAAALHRKLKVPRSLDID